MLRTLTDLGYVAQDGRRFSLAPRILELGFAYLSTQSWIDRAEPLMKELSHTLQESCSAAILQDGEIVYVARMPAPHRLMSTTIAVGTRLPAFHTSLGRIQLGYLGEADLRARLAAATLKRHTPHTITDPEQLVARIRADHAQGYSIVDEELELGLRSIAMPIVTRAGVNCRRHQPVGPCRAHDAGRPSRPLPAAPPRRHHGDLAHAGVRPRRPNRRLRCYSCSGEGLTRQTGAGNGLYEQVYDLAIVGGGLIGTAIARDAAGRGLTAFLCEQGDIGGAASSATDRVVHGGLTHLGRMNWGPLRMRLKERGILHAPAPHLVRPLRFVLPHHEQLWPRWALGLGLAAYDAWAGGRCRVPAASISRAAMPTRRCICTSPRASPSRDCIADDARLTVANAFDAQSRGASINPRMRCVVAERERDRWRLSLESQIDGEWTVVLARMLVNAAGAQAGEVLDHVIHTSRHTRYAPDALQPDRRQARWRPQRRLCPAGRRRPHRPCRAARAGLHADRPGGRPP